MEAIALERSVVMGSAVEHAGAQTLASDLANHLRALLRDVICGHLDTDLVGLADELLLEEEDSEEEQAPELSSGEEVFGDPLQAEEILDVFI